MGDCTLLMACLLALSAVLDRLNRKVRWMKWLEYAAALCVLASVAVPAVNALAPQQPGGGQDGARGVCGGPARTFGLSGRGRNGLYHRHMAGLVLVRGPAPAFRYYNLIGFITDNVGEGLENEFEAFLEQHPIDALFISDDVRHTAAS